MASSVDRHSHSSADWWRSSADEVASAVQNVPAALFFLLFIDIGKKKNKVQKDRILEQKRKKKRKTHIVSPPPFDGCVLHKITHFAPPPRVKLRRLFGKRQNQK